MYLNIKIDLKDGYLFKTGSGLDLKDGYLFKTGSGLNYMLNF